MKLFALLLSLAATGSAHFFITSPVPRAGSSDGTELIYPCGGLPLGTRTTLTPVNGVFPIKGGLAHPTAVANFSIVVGNEDPILSQFAVTFFDGGENLGLVEGYFTFDADVADIPAITDGANAVIQVEMDTADGHLDVCMDVTFSLSEAATTTTTTTTAESGSSSGSGGGATATASTDLAETTTTASFAGSSTFEASAGETTADSSKNTATDLTTAVTKTASSVSIKNSSVSTTASSAASASASSLIGFGTAAAVAVVLFF
ncbi:hypothetical protein HK100_002045 [Physocladia obscura]|uniref:Copper acquisition factor BIM1-like domain-containing protein n=1 Tax=Physocladia obscura TaxID=109957 RepID=A0AAD5T1X8_9FUNG|nr:hypothetical protein HK100_002045 [Physocladia obscura]